MPEKEDVDFTFDTTGFRNGLKDIAKGIGNVTRNTMRMAKNISKGVINAAAKIGMLKLALRGITAAIREMPEIGKTFKIAKEIILKNFLFPVRKAIFPVLQRLLNWVRDNRAMFVKWGQTLVTIFEVVGSAIGRVIEIGKGLLRTFGGFFNRVFGTQIKGLNDLLNILSFKFAVAVEFLSRLLEPVVKIIEPIVKVLVENFSKIMGPISSIANHIIDIGTGLLDASTGGGELKGFFEEIVGFAGDIAKSVLEIVDGFIEGIKPNIGPIVDSVRNLVKQFKDLVSTMLGGEGSLKEWKKIFKWLGDFLSKTFKVAVDGIAFVFKETKDNLQGMTDLLTGEAFTKLEKAGGMESFWKAAGEDFTDFFKNPFDPKWWFGGEGGKVEQLKKVDDAIIKPSGEIIRTNPADYLIATKTPGAMIRKAQEEIPTTPRKAFSFTKPIPQEAEIKSTEEITKINLINKITEKTSETGQGRDITINNNFSGMTIVVKEATPGEAKEKAIDFVSMFRNEINKELVRQGAV